MKFALKLISLALVGATAGVGAHELRGGAMVLADDAAAVTDAKPSFLLPEVETVNVHESEDEDLRNNSNNSKDNGDRSQAEERIVKVDSSKELYRSPNTSYKSVPGHSIRGATKVLDDFDIQTSPDTQIGIGESMSPLIGTSWTALEIAFGEEPNTQQITTISHNLPITLYFDSERAYISGNTGCNNYGGTLQQLSQNSFTTPGGFRLTRKFCRGLIGEQEKNYMKFLKNRTFYFKMASTEDIGAELILLDEMSESEEETTREEIILARFRGLTEDIE
eukprot:CAMPEP_0196132786 /NCGR_PEP_ID=MMETSP0910-20130528/2265_1 /TAXON_ID=49265 /ORGANISM="Thalassiosira rotula, Strain GSO102" /LENGTH=277 /DNA_ID=CAMNT_0041392425 /DNA_START=96 /DNA_END=929 /DNA_ORIENTATION=-